jgi:hypothetical protein
MVESSSRVPIMNNDEITLTRKELYDLVWSEPMTKLADKFGLSDVGLKKKCCKHNIPVPPRGYWARKQAGQKPAVTPLPKGFPLDTELTLYRNPMHGVNSPRPKENRIRTKEIEKRIALSTQSKLPHPLIEQTRRILKSCAPNKDSVLDTPNQICLDLQVSPYSLERALAVMNSIIKALEELGHAVLITDKGTSTVVSGVEIRFSITEELKRRHIEPQEHSLEGYYRFGHSLFSENRVPTGNLCLTIHPPSWTNSRQNWRDTETQKLEDSVTSFIKGLLSIADRHQRLSIYRDE